MLGEIKISQKRDGKGGQGDPSSLWQHFRQPRPRYQGSWEQCTASMGVRVGFPPKLDPSQHCWGTGSRVWGRHWGQEPGVGTEEEGGWGGQ